MRITKNNYGAVKKKKTWLGGIYVLTRQIEILSKFLKDSVEPRECHTLTVLN